MESPPACRLFCGSGDSDHFALRLDWIRLAIKPPFGVQRLITTPIKTPADTRKRLPGDNSVIKHDT
eukprot:5967779-Prorocentrum_lima.AAC.1